MAEFNLRNIYQHQKIAVYDNVSGLHAYCLIRDPHYFQKDQVFS